MILTKVLSTLAVTAVTSVIGFSAVTAQSAITPHFNTYNDVDGIGSESDFLRIGVDGSGGNTIEACEDGQVIDLWFYVHNGAASSLNEADLSGEGVARNTVVDLDINNTTVKARITADNAAKVTDTISVTCGDGDISLEYVGLSDFATTAVTDATLGEYKLRGDGNLMNGEQIGYTGGVVPGCWEYRGRINAQVKVVRAVEETPVVTPAPTATPAVQPDVVAKTLPKTGAGSVVALFASVTSVAGLAYNRLAGRIS